GALPGALAAILDALAVLRSRLPGDPRGPTEPTEPAYLDGVFRAVAVLDATVTHPAIAQLAVAQLAVAHPRVAHPAVVADPADLAGRVGVAGPAGIAPQRGLARPAVARRRAEGVRDPRAPGLVTL